MYSGVAVDTWSLGVLLFLMLTGKYPFQPCPTRENMFKKICAGEFDVPGHVSQGARQVLAGLLQADPEKRMKLASVRWRRMKAQMMRAAVDWRTGHVTSHVTRHTSHVTRHTSHVTRPTSHVIRHTSHVTRHTSHRLRFFGVRGRKRKAEQTQGQMRVKLAAIGVLCWMRD